MLHRVLKGVDGLPGRLPWTDMSGWTPLPPAPSRERAKPAPWYDIPANSSCKGGSPVLICLGCPPGSAHRCSSERLHANRGLHIVATLQHTQLEPAPAARWPHMHPVSTSTCRHSYPGSAPQLQHMLATAGSRCAKPWRQWAPLLHRQRPGRRGRQAAAASAQASQVSHERDARPVNHVSCAHTDPCTCFIHLQPEQEQQTQSGQAALHSSAPSSAAAAAAAAARGGRDLDRLQLSVEGRLGIPQEIYKMVRLGSIPSGLLCSKCTSFVPDTLASRRAAVAGSACPHTQCTTRLALAACAGPPRALAP